MKCETCGSKLEGGSLIPVIGSAITFFIGVGVGFFVHGWIGFGIAKISFIVFAGTFMNFLQKTCRSCDELEQPDENDDSIW